MDKIATAKRTVQHKAWRSKKLTLKQAAEACNMPIGTFYGKARRFENVG